MKINHQHMTRNELIAKLEARAQSVHTASEREQRREISSAEQIAKAQGARVRVGSEAVHGRPVAAVSSALQRRCSSLYACGDVVSGCTRSRDSANVRPEQRVVVRVIVSDG